MDRIFLSCVATILFTLVQTESQTPNEPQHMYDEGVNDYLDNNFEGCIHHLEKAVEIYNSYSRKLQNCRLKCHDEAVYTEPLHPINVDNLLFYEKTIKNTLCLIQCQNKDSELLHFHPNAATVQLFAKRKPYAYLNACYGHNKQLQKAASAAFTYLVVNPNDAGVLATFQHYIKQPDVNVNDIINYEAQDYVYLYVHGTKAYEHKQWDEVIQNMEASLEAFLTAEDECRMQCEGAFDQGWRPDFIPAIANHFTHVLLCKRKCNEQLSTLNGEKHDDLLASHYHYLQYAYFKSGNLKEACRTVASYMLFYPSDKTMMHNWEYYKTLPKVEEDYFQPRPEALQYIHRHTYEEKIFDYITNVFAAETQKLHGNAVDIDSKDSNVTGKRRKLFTLPKPKLKRFAIDNFLTTEECERLVHVANMFSLPGDGYQTGTDSPHTVHENYSGLSLKRAASLLMIDQMDKDSIVLMMNVSENVKTKLVEQLEVTKKLHYTYTHLVCRSAKPDAASTNRTDYSHPVHADNCNVQVNGSCAKEWPAFTWRDFTTILYLNDAFEGGELFFTTDGKHIEEVIRPSCGRLVGFTSGGENLHGVTAIRKGRRCAFAIWFTYDHNNAERERDSLYAIF